MARAAAASAAAAVLRAAAARGCNGRGKGCARVVPASAGGLALEPVASLLGRDTAVGFLARISAWCVRACMRAWCAALLRSVRCRCSSSVFEPLGILTRYVSRLPPGSFYRFKDTGGSRDTHPGSVPCPGSP